jgi:hypothetical protein
MLIETLFNNETKMGGFFCRQRNELVSNPLKLQLILFAKEEIKNLIPNGSIILLDLLILVFV